MRQKWASGEQMEDLGQIGIHPLALARGKYHDVHELRPQDESSGDGSTQALLARFMHDVHRQ
jgi:hypothetical protein